MSHQSQLAAYRSLHRQRIELKQTKTPPAASDFRRQTAASSIVDSKRSFPQPATRPLAAQTAATAPTAAVKDSGGEWKATAADKGADEDAWGDTTTAAAESVPERVEDDAETGVYLESSLCALFPADAKRMETEIGNDTDVVTMEQFTAEDVLVRVRFVPGSRACACARVYVLV